MKTVILSAFGRFGNYPANSTELIAKKLNGTRLSGVKIHSAIFDCVIPQNNRGEVLFSLAKRIGATGVICLGMASDKKGLCVELTTKNAVDSKYCPPEINRTPIRHSLAYEHSLGLDLTAWNIPHFESECEKELIPLLTSNDPGAFCCNHLMFQLRMLQLEEAQFSRIPFIYIHIPCSQEAVVDRAEHKSLGKSIMPIDQVIKGLDILIRNATLPKHI